MHKLILAALVKADLIDASATQGEALVALKAWAKASGHTLPENLNDDAAASQVASLISGETPAAPPATPPTSAQPPAAGGLDHADIVAMVRLSSLAADAQLELVADLSGQTGLTNRQVLDAINERVRQSQPQPGATGGEPVSVTASEVDKFHAAARDAILLAGMPGQIPETIYNRASDSYVEWKPERRNQGLASPLAIARQALIVAGYPAMKVLNLGPMALAQLVMGAQPGDVGLGGFFASSDGPAYNVSGMFSNILLDAQNVALRRSYDETRVTFDQWMGRGADIPDFKAVHRVIAGELNDPAAIPEDGEFEETTLSDGKESYKLTVWGRMMSRSWQLIVNDQLGAFVEIEAKMGAAMRRKLNRLAYQHLKDNAALSDTGALFNATAITTAGGHNNLTTGALSTSADYVGAWNTMTQKMSEQKGLDADSHTLNLMPEYVVIPPALRGIVRQTLGSPSVAINTGGNSGTMNIWEQGLTPIEDAELGAGAGGSDTAFYLAAGSSQVDTIEYAYLAGLPAPVVERADAFDRLATRTRIYFAFGVKALDFRGLQKHTGQA